MESINTEFCPFLSINECNRLILSYFPLPEVSTGTVIIMKEERKEEEKVYIWILNLNEHKWSSFNNIGRGFSALDLKSHYEIELLPRNTSLWLEGGLTENRCVFLDIFFFLILPSLLLLNGLDAQWSMTSIARLETWPELSCLDYLSGWLACLSKIQLLIHFCGLSSHS